MQFRSALLLTACLFAPVFGAPFQMNFTWTAVAGANGNSADRFAFQFSNPSGQWQVSQMEVTLGRGMIYDLSNLGAGYLTWGPLAFSDGGAGSSILGAPLGEGVDGNRTITWNFTNFVNGITFGYRADVDEARMCPGGIAGLICQVNADSISGVGFVSRGAIAVTLTIEDMGGGGARIYTFPASEQMWNLSLATASTTYSVPEETPEPAAWILTATGLLLLHYRRRHRVRHGPE